MGVICASWAVYGIPQKKYYNYVHKSKDQQIRLTNELWQMYVDVVPILFYVDLLLNNNMNNKEYLILI